MIITERKNSEDSDFKALVRFLDLELKERDGEEHLFYAQLNSTGYLEYVIVAYSQGSPVGCGALREYSPGSVEIKRVFVPVEKRRQGIASAILTALEIWSKQLNFQKCILETGSNQPEAIRLYNKHGYKVIPNYGKYINSSNSICFEKTLIAET